MNELPWIFSRFDFQAAIDIVIVTLILFLLFTAVRRTAATQVIRGAVIVMLAAVVLSSILQLSALSWLIRNSIPALLVAVPVVFQPELRRGLQKLGRTNWLSIPFGRRPSGTSSHTLDEVSRACCHLAEQHAGALIVLERETGLSDYVENGVLLDATVSAPLLTSIFYPGSALHDGAVIIGHDRMLAANCVLPLSENVLGKDFPGTRHRAAIGLSERSDAVVIAISEEHGTIALAWEGKLTPKLSEEKLRTELSALLRPTDGRGNESSQ